MEDQNGTLGSTIREGDDGYTGLNVIEMANCCKYCCCHSCRKR